MAWMNQEKKAKIAVELKKVMPSGWRYSLRVHHHSSIILTIASAPVDLYSECLYTNKSGNYIQLNEYYLEHAYSGELLKVFESIKRALNIDNHDNSDLQSDYFDVGHYVSIHIGQWDKPFVTLSQSVAA